MTFLLSKVKAKAFSDTKQPLSIPFDLNSER